MKHEIIVNQTRICIHKINKSSPPHSKVERIVHRINHGMPPLCIVVKSGAGGFRRVSIRTPQSNVVDNLKCITCSRPSRSREASLAHVCPVNRPSKRQYVSWPAGWISQVSATKELHTGGNDERNIIISIFDCRFSRSLPAIGSIDTAYHIPIADHRTTRLRPVMTLESKFLLRPFSASSSLTIQLPGRMIPLSCSSNSLPNFLWGRMSKSRFE